MITSRLDKAKKGATLGNVIQILISKPIDFVFFSMMFPAVFIIYLIFISSRYQYDSIVLAQFASYFKNILL